MPCLVSARVKGDSGTLALEAESPLACDQGPGHSAHLLDTKSEKQGEDCVSKPVPSDTELSLTIKIFILEQYILNTSHAIPEKPPFPKILRAHRGFYISLKQPVGSPTPSLCLFSSPRLSSSLSLSISLYLSPLVLSLSLSLSPPVLVLFLSISLSLPFTLSLSLSLSPPLRLYLSLSLSFSLLSSLSLPLSLPPLIPPSLPSSLSLSLALFLYHLPHLG